MNFICTHCGSEQKITLKSGVNVKEMPCIKCGCFTTLKRWTEYDKQVYKIIKVKK